ncbi:MAG TPA: zinc-binding dehydrogenase [Dehalococcoidia bacterium]|nr:zinc-binding dehydrogenase [Dehalococcoidia bacterium]
MTNNATTSRAVVQTAPRTLEMRELPLPDIGDDDALLRIEACGICGSDYEQYEGVLPVRFPVVPGHEPVGRIERIGPQAAERWGVAEGDRVCVEALLPSPEGLIGRGGLSAYGHLSVDRPPGLWGGFADYLYLAPNAVVHRIDDAIPPEIATLFNPIGAGFRWAVAMPQLQPGETLVVLGSGQRGIASVIAAKEAGAGTVIVTGLARDANKLALAKEFGADITVSVEAEDVRAIVRDATDGRGADVVIDVTAYATEAVTQAIDLARRGGRVVLAGTKGQNAVEGFFSDRIVMKELTLIGALGVDYDSYERAIRLIESGKYPLERLHTHTVPLTEAERALDLLAGKVAGEEAVHIALVP